MKVDGITPILNVSDLGASLEWFEALGWRTGFTWGEPPTFASVVCGGPEGSGEIFLCLDNQGARGVWMSWFVSTRAELEAAHARARASWATRSRGNRPTSRGACGSSTSATPTGTCSASAAEPARPRGGQSPRPPR